MAERIWTGHPLLLRLWCVLFGHEPGARDWIGRPTCCVRCWTYDAEMGRRAYERFCGKAAIADWNAEAATELDRRRQEGSGG